MYRLYLITNDATKGLDEHDLKFTVFFFTTVVPSLCQSNRPVTVRVLKWLVALCDFTSDVNAQTTVSIYDYRPGYAFSLNDPSKSLSKVALLKPLLLQCIFEIWKHQSRLAWHRLRFIINSFSLFIRHHSIQHPCWTERWGDLQEMTFVCASIVWFVTFEYI
jgi:hypothetical protein